MMFHLRLPEGKRGQIGLTVYQRQCSGRVKAGGSFVERSPVAVSIWAWIRKKLWVRSAPLRSAPRRSAPLRSVTFRSARRRSAPRRYVPMSAARLRTARLRSAPMRSASTRTALVRSAPPRRASLRFARYRSDSLRSARLKSARPRSVWPRSACLRSTFVPGFLALHLFQSATELRSLATCSLSAMSVRSLVRVVVWSENVPRARIARSFAGGAPRPQTRLRALLRSLLRRTGLCPVSGFRYRQTPGGALPEPDKGFPLRHSRPPPGRRLPGVRRLRLFRCGAEGHADHVQWAELARVAADGDADVRGVRSHAPASRIARVSESSVDAGSRRDAVRRATAQAGRAGSLLAGESRRSPEARRGVAPQRGE